MTELTSIMAAEQVKVGFRRRRRDPVFWALDDVSLKISSGRTVGLVGESGSGKSTFAKSVLGLVPVAGGRIRIGENEVTDSRSIDHRRLARTVQAVFQDPSGSLNPSYTIGRSLAEPLTAQNRVSRPQAMAAVEHALERVGLEPSIADRLPRHFSGGQRQRICIARALMTGPQLLICDEAVSALDLSVQAQILNLLMDLQEQSGLAYLFISHDMNVVKRICHDVTVLYRGQVMESGPARMVTQAPAHPYTRTLLLASPISDPVQQAARRSAAMPPARGARNLAAETSEGCPFASRCAFATSECSTERPELRPIGAGVSVACHRYPDWQDEVDILVPTAKENIQ